MRIYFTLIASVFIVAGVSSRSLSSSDGMTPPYVNYFDDGDSSLDGYTLINLNDDGTNWTVVDGKAGMDGNAAQPMDAWLITPAIRLGTDYIYEMTLDGICQDAGKTECVEVFLGTAPTVEAMTTRIMERTNVMRTYPVSYWNSFDLKSEGTYYIGIHGCSNAGSSRLLIDNLGVRPWRSTAFPAAIDDLTAVVDNVGKMMVDISFTAPSVTYSGQPLTSITRIELKLNGVLVHTFDAPSPGERLSYSGKVIAKGDYTYSAVVVNEAGESFPAETVVRAGVTRPAPVTVTSVRETGNEGEVTIAWEPPAVDVDGDPLHPSQLTYSITDNDGQLLVLNQPACSYTYQAVEPGGPQRLVGYTISASTNSGAYISNSASTPVIPVGPAYTIPMYESFADDPDAGHCVWSYTIPEGSTATVQRFTDGDGVASMDGDNGFYGTVATEKGMPALITSGKLHVGDEPNPALTFYYYAFAGGQNTIDVQIDKGSGFETVRSFVAGAAVRGWKRAVVPLSGYRGRDIRFGFYTNPVTNGKTLFDNIRVISLHDNDLAVTFIRLPRRMPARSETTVTVGVGNYGMCRAGDYVVELYRNGALVQTAPGPALEAGADTTVSFREAPGIFSGDTVSYHAVIGYAADGDPTNNATATARTVVLLPECPTVSDLACRRTSDCVALTWGEPGATGVTSGAVTDDFEAYEAFAADEAGRWMFIDGDGGITYQFSVSDYPNASVPKAYIVMTSLPKLDIGPHSGKKCMASFPASDGRSDDWMISPELAGNAQTVSFFVKSVSPVSDKSTFQFGYSLSGVDRDDFIMVGDEQSAPFKWGEQRFDVPAGAAYFTIRCTSSGQSVLFVDDVTYVPASSAPLGLVGYNVYRDGVLLNGEPLPEPGYTDGDADAGEHEYFVTVVYDRGESCPSNVVTTGTAGLVVGSASPDVFSLSASDGEIVVSGAEGRHVTVSTLAGRRVYSGAGTASMRLCVGSGVYIVRVGVDVMKIIVR